MQNGLYKVAFKTPIGSGAGVVVIQNGSIRGGDSSMFYSGTYVERGAEFTATVVSKKHTSVVGIDSVFGKDTVTIALKGSSTDNSALLTGVAREAPGVSFEAKLTRVDE
jgi:hypothetical protein